MTAHDGSEAADDATRATRAATPPADGLAVSKAMGYLTEWLQQFLPEWLREGAPVPEAWRGDGGSDSEWEAIRRRSYLFLLSERHLAFAREVAGGMAPHELAQGFLDRGRVRLPQGGAASMLGASEIPDYLRDKASELLAANSRLGSHARLTPLECQYLREISAGSGSRERAVNLIGEYESRLFISLPPRPHPQTPVPHGRAPAANGERSLWND